MESKLQIFISSTYTDLIYERQAAIEAILKSGHIPAGMELFTAGDRSQWEVIQRWIMDADIYMLILGGRYGSIEPVSGTSYTELEYDFAVSCGKPYFAVVIDEKTLADRAKLRGPDVTEKDHPDKLKAFRTKVLSKISSFFSDPKDVKLTVLETVPQLASEYKLSGWVRATDIPDTKALADELSKLHAENKELSKKVASQAKTLARHKSEVSEPKVDFTELIALLKETEIDITDKKHLLGDGSDKLPDKISLFLLFFAFRDSLMSGITNNMGMSDLAQFTFFTICPRLQTYDLVQNEKVPGVQFRRCVITSKGTQLLAYLDKEEHRIKVQKKTSAPAKKITD